MKRILTILLVLAIVAALSVALIACDKKDDTAHKAQDNVPAEDDPQGPSEDVEDPLLDAKAVFTEAGYTVTTVLVPSNAVGCLGGFSAMTEDHAYICAFLFETEEQADAYYSTFTDLYDNQYVEEFASVGGWIYVASANAARLFDEEVIVPDEGDDFDYVDPFPTTLDGAAEKMENAGYETEVTDFEDAEGMISAQKGDDRLFAILFETEDTAATYQEEHADDEAGYIRDYGSVTLAGCWYYYGTNAACEAFEAAE